MLLPSFDRVIQTHFRVLAERRMAAVALALRCYAANHDGKLPQSLAELTPKYLPAVPSDPMAAGGKPLRYLPDSTQPILYSVGENGTDEGGSTRPSDPRFARMQSGSIDQWQMLDAVVYLNRRPRPPAEPEDDADVSTSPATTQPAAEPSQ